MKKNLYFIKIYENSIELLMSNGYRREAINIIKSHGRLLRQFASDCHNIESKQDFYLQVNK